MSRPLVSVVILNWNGERLLNKCLDSLKNTEYKQVQIITVDNNSSDASLEIIHSYGDRIDLIRNESNLGYAAGNNKAIPILRGKYVCFLNNDIEVDPLWLSKAVEIFEKYARVGSVACRQMNFFERNKIDGLFHELTDYLTLYAFARGRDYDSNYFFHEPGFVTSALGASAIYRTDIIRELGGFDESFFAYYEEADLCMRLNNMGYKCIYVPDAIVYHMDRASFSAQSNMSFYYSQRNKAFYLKKNFPPAFIRAHFKQIILEELRVFKSVVSKPKMLSTFIKAKVDAIKALRSYKFAASNAFNSEYINKLIKQKKIPL